RLCSATALPRTRRPSYGLARIYRSGEADRDAGLKVLDAHDVRPHHQTSDLLGKAAGSCVELVDLAQRAVDGEEPAAIRAERQLVDGRVGEVPGSGGHRVGVDGDHASVSSREQRP